MLVPGDGGVMVFSIPTSGSVFYLPVEGNGSAVVTVPNLQSLRTSNTRLLVLLVNKRHVSPYYNTSEIRFEGYLGNTNFTVNLPNATIDFEVEGLKNLWHSRQTGPFDLYYGDYPPEGTPVVISAHLTSKVTCSPGLNYTFRISAFGQQQSTTSPCLSSADLLLSANVTSSHDLDISFYDDWGEGTLASIAINSWTE